MKRFFIRIRGAWRLFWGLCPKCNSDAPAVDHCPVCRGWKPSFNDPFPPESWRRDEWRQRFMEMKNP